jgi:hypothetical protein
MSRGIKVPSVREEWFLGQCPGLEVTKVLQIIVIPGRAAISGRDAAYEYCNPSSLSRVPTIEYEKSPAICHALRSTTTASFLLRSLCDGDPTDTAVNLPQSQPPNFDIPPTPGLVIKALSNLANKIERCRLAGKRRFVPCRLGIS